jgi:hypothetical protein
MDQELDNRMQAFYDQLQGDEILILEGFKKSVEEEIKIFTHNLKLALAAMDTDGPDPARFNHAADYVRAIEACELEHKRLRIALFRAKKKAASKES